MSNKPGVPVIGAKKQLPLKPKSNLLELRIMQRVFVFCSRCGDPILVENAEGDPRGIKVNIQPCMRCTNIVTNINPNN